MTEGKRFVNFYARVGFEKDTLVAVPVGRVLLAHAGIELENAEEKQALPLDRLTVDLSDQKMNFVIMVYGLTALGDETAWYRELTVDPKGPARQLADFQLRADRVGEGELTFDIISNAKIRWVKRLSFPFTVVPS